MSPPQGRSPNDAFADKPARLSPLLFEVLEQCAQSVFITDDKGRIQYANPAFTALTGHSAESVFNQTPRILQSGRTASLTYKELWSRLSTGKPWRGKLQNRKKDGSLFWCSCTISPLRTTDGTVTHFLAVEDDISEQVDEEERLKRSVEQMRAFTSMVAHDLRSPLASIVSALRLLESQDRGMRGEFLDAARATVNRTIALVDDLLNYSQLEGKMLPLKPLPLETPVKAAIENLSGKLRATGGQIRFGPLPVVYGDSGLLCNLFQNLFENSLKYCDGIPQIEVSAVSTADQCMVRVTDNGIGITPEDAKALFTPFKRLYQSGREVEGTGLGLYLCKRIIEIHKGSIGIESEGRGGVSIWFTLNAAPGCSEAR